VNQDFPMMCPLCDTQLDSHTHLFFQCRYSSVVWKDINAKAGVQPLPRVWDCLVPIFLDLAKSKTRMALVKKLILCASVYFIWWERNNRIFKKEKRSSQQLVDQIWESTRLKLLTVRLKRTEVSDDFLNRWKIPERLLI